jgi:hypothetical protein
VQYKKGLTARPWDLIEWIYQQQEPEEHGWLFHARAASIGPRVEELVQPFGTPTGMLVHNGTWGDWEKAFWPLIVQGKLKKDDIYFNDSKTAAMLTSVLGLRALRWIGSGVFVWWDTKGGLTLCKNNGQFEVSSLPEKEGGGVVYASAFPFGWPVEAFNVKPGYLGKMLDGGLPPGEYLTAERVWTRQVGFQGPAEEGWYGQHFAD